MDEETKKQIIFVLEDDNELMAAALDPDSGLDEENKQMNRDLIKGHEAIIDKVEKGRHLVQEDLRLIWDANEIHLNDEDNINGRHKQAIELDKWLDSQEPSFDDEGRCLKCGSRVSFADVTDTVVFVGDDIVKRYDGDITNRNCVRCTYPKQYSDYEDYDKR